MGAFDAAVIERGEDGAPRIERKKRTGHHVLTGLGVGALLGVLTPFVAIPFALIGAGAGGLAAAHDLARAGHHVVQYEAGDQVGGLAAGFKEPGWDWSLEKYYHHWFASDRAILGLIAELGWSDRLLFPWPITAASSRLSASG